MEVSAWSKAANSFPDGWIGALVMAAVSVATVVLWRCDVFGEAWRFLVLFNVSHQHFLETGNRGPCKVLQL